MTIDLDGAGKSRFLRIEPGQVGDAGAPIEEQSEIPFGGNVRGEEGRVSDLGAAKHTIGLLRGSTNHRQAFGGRVQLGGVDPKRVIEGYYPASFKTLERLAQHPEHHEELAAFVGTDASLPDDLRPVITRAYQLGKKVDAPVQQQLEAEPRGRLGGVEETAVWLRALQNDDASGLALEDEAVKQFWEWATTQPRVFQGIMRFLDENDLKGGARIAAIRLYARVFEVHQGPIFPMLPEHQQIPDLLHGLPDTPQAASALLRLYSSAAKAPEDTFEVMPFLEKHGYDPRVALIKACVPGRKVGDLNLSLLARRDGFGRGEIALTRQSDPSIEKMFSDHAAGQSDKFLYNFASPGRDPVSPEFVVGMIHVVGRAAEIRALPQLDAAKFQQAVLAQITPDRYGAELIRLAALGARRIAQARQLDESCFSVGGRSLVEILEGADAAAAQAIPRRAKSEREKTEAERIRPGLLAELDPATPTSEAKRRDAIVKLLGDREPRHEFDDLVNAAVVGRTRGKLSPVLTGDLGNDEMIRFFRASAGSWTHAPCASILTGLYTDLPAAKVLGGGEWSEVATQLTTMGPELLGYTFSAGASDLEAIRIRSSLAREDLDARQLELAMAKHRGEAKTFVPALLDRMRLEPIGGELRTAALELLANEVEQHQLDFAALATKLDPKVAYALESEAAAIVEPLLAEVRGGANDDAIARLEQALSRYGMFAQPGYVRAVLKALHEGDLREHVGLLEADRQLGVVPALKLDRKAAIDPDAAWVQGIPLKRWPGERRKGAPDEPRMVETPTTKRQLRIAAGVWNAGLNGLFKGATSQGKTTMIRYLCAVTNTPYNRIVCSQATTAEDLIGRWVGGEKRFDEKELKAKTAEELEALELEYGLEDEHLAPKALIERLLVVQHEARFVYGRLVKSLMRGECAVLDEFYNLRDGVKDAINRLFDDDGNLMIEDNDGEIIRPKEGARVFASTNDVDEIGRTSGARSSRSRWVEIPVDPLEDTDIAMIAKELYGDRIPASVLDPLVNAHCELDRLAQHGDLVGGGGAIAFTLRNLFKVCDRFIRYRGGELDDAQLLRREIEETYLELVTDPEQRQHARDQLEPHVGKHDASWYANLQVELSDLGFTIGDVFVPNEKMDHPLVSKHLRLTMTPRVKEAFYKLCKAMDMGEHAMLVGGSASGKSLMATFYAQIRGQPCYEQQFTDKISNRKLIGKFTPKGWVPGAFVRASMPSKAPGIFVANEYNMAPPPVAERLNSALDDERRMTLVEHEGEEYQLDPDFRFIGTMNEGGQGYTQRFQLSRAAKNRVTFIHVPELDDPNEMKIIAEDLAPHLGVDAGIALTFVDLQEWLISQYANDELGKNLREEQKPQLTMRSIINGMKHVAANQAALDEDEAFVLACDTVFGTYKEDRDSVLAEARRRIL